MVSRLLLLSLLVLVLFTPSVSAAPSSRPQVGPIMALLAVFEEADALPSETSPDANALIHALIQTQAALTKSTNPSTRQWFSEALRHAQAEGSRRLSDQALTSRTLEAILSYAAHHPPAAQPEVLAGLREFNVGQTDFDLMTRIYANASTRLRQAGKDIHVLYKQARRTMTFQ